MPSAWWFCSSSGKDQSSWVLCRLLCAAILQTMCQWGTDKQRNKGQDIVSVNEANFKGFSEAFLKPFTEPQCFSNHMESSLTKSGKTVKDTLKQLYTLGLLKKSELRGKFRPYSVYKLLSWEYKRLMTDYMTLWTHPLRHVTPSKTKLLSLQLIRYCT